MLHIVLYHKKQRHSSRPMLERYQISTLKFINNLHSTFIFWNKIGTIWIKPTMEIIPNLYPSALQHFPRKSSLHWLKGDTKTQKSWTGGFLFLLCTTGLGHLVTPALGIVWVVCKHDWEINTRSWSLFLPPQYYEHLDFLEHIHLLKTLLNK